MYIYIYIYVYILRFGWAQWRLKKKNVFGHRQNRNLNLHRSFLYASTQKVHGLRSQLPLHFDTGNIQQICTKKEFPSARRLLPVVMLERWPHVCRVKIMFT